MTDTDRLEYLMQFFDVTDCGDEYVCPGMTVDVDAVSDAFDCGPLSGEVITLMEGWINHDMRRAIDKAIEFHAKPAPATPGSEGDGADHKKGVKQ
jgi:hypothetical protein